MVTLYGIANCDTIRKAKKWLDAEGVEYRFHDFRKHGLERDKLAGWVDRLGWEVLLNKRGTTWRKLDEADKQDIDTAKAIDLLLAHPAMIKRPVLEAGDHLLVGFDEQQYRNALGLA